MAQAANATETFYKLLRGSARDPLQAFELFVLSDWRETQFAQNSDNYATCLLDYMYVWLVEGDGALHCPTYEAWMLAVVRFADKLFLPTARFKDTSLGSIIRERHPDTGRHLLLMKSGNTRHPALDRSVYDSCREHVVRRLERPAKE